MQRVAAAAELRSSEYRAAPIVVVAQSHGPHHQRRKRAVNQIVSLADLRFSLASLNARVHVHAWSANLGVEGGRTRRRGPNVCIDYHVQASLSIRNRVFCRFRETFTKNAILDCRKNCTNEAAFEVARS
jgi:hypothetical protein